MDNTLNNDTSTVSNQSNINPNVIDNQDTISSPNGILSSNNNEITNAPSNNNLNNQNNDASVSTVGMLNSNSIVSENNNPNVEIDAVKTPAVTETLAVETPVVSIESNQMVNSLNSSDTSNQSQMSNQLETTQNSMEIH